MRPISKLVLLKEETGYKMIDEPQLTWFPLEEIILNIEKSKSSRPWKLYWEKL